MFQQVVVLVFLDGVLDVEQGLGVVLLGEINPCISIDKVGIIWLVLNGKCRHTLGTVQILATLGKVVGIVVEGA